MNAPASPPDEFAAVGASLESERKFSVPPARADELWRALAQGFDTGRFGESITATPGEADYLDTYHDSPDLALMRQGCGLRHRVRLSGEYAEIVQLKSETPGEGERLERSFPVWSERFGRATGNVTDRILHEHRPSFREALRALGVKTTDLQPVLSLRQRRRRLHVGRNGQPLLTLSLDAVESRFWWETFSHTELEIELDTPEAEPLARRIAQACGEQGLLPDQTPKYRKAYEYFNGRYLKFPVALKARTPVELMAGGALLLGAIGLTALLSLGRKR